MSNESRDFINRLATSDIWILVVALRGLPVIPDVMDPSAFDIIAAHRIDVSELGDDDSVFPFNYQRENRQTLPFFSSEDRARHFAADNDVPINLSIFQPYSLRAGFVAAPENDDLDLILDPRSPAERKIDRDDRLLLRQLTDADA